MEHTLSNGEKIEFDPNEVYRDPQRKSREWLEERAKGNNDRSEARDLADYTDDELYAELGRIGVEKARLGRRRDQYTDHTRRYWNERRKRVAGELRRRKLPVKRSGSQKILATAAHLAARGRELREAAA